MRKASELTIDQLFSYRYHLSDMLESVIEGMEDANDSDTIIDLGLKQKSITRALNVLEDEILNITK